LDAQEQPVGSATVENGALITSFTAYEPRTFALRLRAPLQTLASIQSQPIPLHYDLATATNDDTQTPSGGFDMHGNAIPAEMLPSTISYHDVQFKLASSKTGEPNAVIAKGQTIELPEGAYGRVYVLAASMNGDQNAVFRTGNRQVNVKVQDWSGFIGQWDTRLWKEQPGIDWATSAHHAVWPPPDLKEREQRPAPRRYPEDYLGLQPGYVKTAGVAWYASHQHTPQGLNQPYKYAYLFAYPIDLPPGQRTLTLPNNSNIRVFAISAVEHGSDVTPAQPLYDTLNRSEP